MTTTVLVGLTFLLLGAICGGSFGLPSKYVRKDTPWENLWGPFFFFITIAMPLLLGPILVNDFFPVYAKAGADKLIMPLLFGLLWGAGSMTLGKSFAFIGLSLAYSLNYGAQIIFGGITPLVLHHSDRLLTAQVGVILLGVCVCLVGVIVSGRAGILKDRSLKDAEAGEEIDETPSERAVTEIDEPADAPSDSDKKPAMMIGLIIAIASGILCGCYGVAASYTGSVAEAAKELGNEPWRVSIATTIVILWGGAVSSCLYCVVQLTKNNTWKNFSAPGAGLALAMALVMAFLHNGAIYFFNLGFPKLGDLGVPVGYPVFMSFAIIVGNIHGFRTGEWKGASSKSIGWIVTGIVILILGVCILAQGNAMDSG